MNYLSSSGVLQAVQLLSLDGMLLHYQNASLSDCSLPQGGSPSQSLNVQLVLVHIKQLSQCIGF